MYKAQLPCLLLAGIWGTGSSWHYRVGRVRVLIPSAAPSKVTSSSSKQASKQGRARARALLAPSFFPMALFHLLSKPTCLSIGLKGIPYRRLEVLVRRLSPCPNMAGRVAFGTMLGVAVADG